MIICDICHPVMALLRGSEKPSMSPRGLSTGSRKITKNINNIDIFNWIP
ncbi:MAG TPA: proline/betaine transporter [Rickettsia endosymbiont of Pyrocoelia pectoralis]|nr:proline/betaine transporter [Rickettsia endosymbiont of Pyrocoelia pectoralis]